MNIPFLTSVVIPALRVPDTIHRINYVDFLFFSSDADKSDVIAGKHFDRILHPLIEEFQHRGMTCASVAVPYAVLCGSRCAVYCHSLNRAALLSSLKSPIARLLNRRENDLQRLYSYILRQASPRAVFTIDAPAELCAAAHRLKIPVVEVLHGRGYPAVFSNWAERNEVTLPSHIVSFDGISSATFRDFSGKNFEVIQLKRLWTPQYIRALHSQFALNSSQSQPLAFDSQKKQILVSLQWSATDETSSEEHGPTQRNLIPGVVRGAMEASAEFAQWHFRLHPVQMRSPQHSQDRSRLEFELQNCDSAEWQVASSTPLPVLLEAMTHHITFGSMTAYDAADAGIPTLLLSEPSSDTSFDGRFMADLKAAGFVSEAPAAGDGSFVAEWIRSTSVREPFSAEADFEDIDELLRKVTLAHGG